MNIMYYTRNYLACTFFVFVREHACVCIYMYAYMCVCVCAYICFVS